MKTKIEWRKVEGFDNYLVSNMGQIKHARLDRVMEMKSERGYTFAYMRGNDGKNYSKRVHRLVAVAFVENPNGYPEVDHINRVRTDNRATNLRWNTRSGQNKNKIFKIGTVEHIIQLHKEGFTNDEIYEHLALNGYLITDKLIV
tara:strand:- start:2091 stop:2522 length:432 start_codon:yes stop_codon:yes gene_type:complete